MSTLSMSLLLRSTVMSSQSRLAVAQAELASGRSYDVGLSLGPRISSDIRFRSELAELQLMTDRVAQARVKSELTQSALESIGNLADDFLSTMTGARGADEGQKLARTAAELGLGNLINVLNTSYDGQFVFGGINSSEPPLAAYHGSSAEVALDNAFLAHFGFAQDDPSVSSISGADMESFLSGPFEVLFDGASWSTDWSRASDKGVLTRLGPSLSVDASVSANEEPFRKLAAALTMVMDLGQDRLGQSAFEAVVDAAMGLIAEARLDLGSVQSRVGLAQGEMAIADAGYQIRKMSLTRDVQTLESVEPFEAATRVNEIMSQLEMSYTISGRLRQLNLMNYI
ncbi:MAG: flagellar hook-associated family protein [Alphaproteobacteria bacterium]|nr:flagellar hook-associated family protein [Alphaproteobacteria bacterium]